MAKKAYRRLTPAEKTEKDGLIELAIQEAVANGETPNAAKIARFAGVYSSYLYNLDCFRPYVQSRRSPAPVTVITPEAPKQHVEATFEAYEDFIKGSYFQHFQSHDEAMLDMSETVLSFDHELFKQCMNLMQAQGKIVRHVTRADLWILKQQDMVPDLPAFGIVAGEPDVELATDEDSVLASYVPGARVIYQLPSGVRHRVVEVSFPAPKTAKEKELIEHTAAAFAQARKLGAVITTEFEP